MTIMTDATPPTNAAQTPSIGWKIVTFGLRAKWKRALLLWMRFAANPVLTLRWWHFLRDFTAAQNLSLPHDELIQKPFTKFFVGKTAHTTRLALLMDNFTLAQSCFSPDVMNRLWKGETVELGRVSGRLDTYHCTLALADLCGGRHEGAFAIRLIREDDNVIMWTVKFMFVRPCPQANWTFAVGGMQGPRGGKQGMVEVTRDLYGLRPKEALLLVLQGILPAGTQSYFAVSHARHPITYRRLRRQNMLFSDVDGFWREREAEPDETFGFKVPVSRLEGARKRSAMKQTFATLATAVRKAGP